MKKIILLLLTVSMIAAAFVGCSDKPDSKAFGSTSADTNGNGLRDDVELKILKAHHKKTGMDKYEELRLDIHEVSYFGKYNGAYIVVLSCGYTLVPNSNSKSTVDFYSIPNEQIFSSDYRGTIAWYKEELRSILSLLDEGVLSEDDLMEFRGKLQERRENKN